jgi:RNA polymerase sigma factor (sigma-70 family)
MSSVPRSALVRQFRVLFEAGTVAGLTDGQLLERFLDRRSEAGEIAFEALVSRHGPMVLGVCRRALADPNDAADAFQATFLILVRKAHSIRVGDSLGPWIYGVSRKVAARARIEASRRPRTIPENLEALAINTDGFELSRILDEELARLPQAFRNALILCDLQGLTHEEAARDLVCPVGTIKSRLARGRRKLRERLERRGFAPSMMVLGSPVLPSRLAEAVAMTFRLTRHGGTMKAGMVSASTIALAQGVLKPMSGFSMKLAATAVLSLGVITAGAGVLAQGQKQDPKGTVEGREVSTIPGDQEKPAVEEPGRHVVEVQSDRITLDGQVVNDDVAREAGNLDRLQNQLAATKAKLKKAQRIARDPSDPAIRRSQNDIADLQVELALIEIDKILNEVKATETLIGRPGKPEPIENRRNIPIDSKKVETPEYIVEPPDIISVEVVEALQGKPIIGDRLVRPDGKISLGFYGDVYVAGLTPTEIKEKIAVHLRDYLDDRALGLIENHPGTLKLEKVEPLKTNRVIVRVTTINQAYWVEGEVARPGRYPSSRQETVLDAINKAGGPMTDGKSIRVLRRDPTDRRKVSSLPVDYDAIVKKGDTATNYRLLQGDRVVVFSSPAEASRSDLARNHEGEAETQLQTIHRKLEELHNALDRLSK